MSDLPPRPTSKALRFAPLAIVLIAGVLRMWRLGDVPPGFQFDEAHNAIDAARFLDGIRPLFLPDNGGREILLTWLHAPALAGLGRDHPVFAIRMVSAMIGTVTVTLVGVVIGLVFGNRRLGWLAAAFLALMYWHLHFSRYAIRAILAPLWATGAIGAWWMATSGGVGGRRVQLDQADGRDGADERDVAGRDVSGGSDGAERSSRIGLDRRPLPTWLAWSIICGLCLAASVYSHPSGRLLPLILVAHAAFRLLGARGQGDGTSLLERARPQLRALVTAGVTALVVFVPLALFFARHPELFTGHASDVSLAAVAARDHDGSLGGALLANAWAIAGMFAAAGDPSTFHNLPALPVYDPLTALLAAFGAGVLLGHLFGRGRQPSSGAVASVRPSARAPGLDSDRAALVVAWLAVGLIPTLLSDRPPNYSRAIATVPIIALLPALGLLWVLPRLAVMRRAAARAADRRRMWDRAIIAIALVVAGAWTTWHHFVAFPEIDHVYYSYDVEKLDAFAALNALARGETGWSPGDRVESGVDGLSSATSDGTSSEADVFLHPLWARHATIDYLNRFVIPGTSGEVGPEADRSWADDDRDDGGDRGVGSVRDDRGDRDTGGDPDSGGDRDLDPVPIADGTFRIRSLDPRDTLVLPAGGGDTVVAAPAKEDAREGMIESAATLFTASARHVGPERDDSAAASSPTRADRAPATRVITDALGAPLLSTLTIPAGAWGDLEPPTDAPLEPAVWTNARFGGAIDMLGYSLGRAQAGEALPITIVWRSLEPIGRDLTVFVHLMGPEGQSWGQDDREPGHASFRTSEWRSGDVVVDRYRPTLDPGAIGQIGLCIGWYDRSTGERLGAGDDRDAFCPRPIIIETR